MASKVKSKQPKAESGPSKKRAASPDSSDAPNTKKIAKVHPFFTKPDESNSTTPDFQWLKPLGSSRSCLHGINLSPKSSPKVAAFDLDGTVIKSNHKNTSKDAVLEWEWWRSDVPTKLRELHNTGFSVVLISNQAIKSARLEGWKKKIPLIAAALPDVPFRMFAATAKDGYRKPMVGMWSELERLFNEDGIQIDKTASFFVGDAAGRKNDFASTDRKWAINVGVPFFTPEEYFLRTPSATFDLPGFHVSSLPDLPRFTPTSTPLLPAPSSRTKPEVVLFVGYPCLGKSTVFRRHFQPAGYVHINQDTLGTRPKCIKALEEGLRSGKSCVVDNTNRDAQTRKHYLDLAKKLKVPVRCFLFTGSIELAWHNNLYGTYNLPPSVSPNEPKRTIVPYMVFTGFRDNHEEPQLAEGFSEIKKVNWVFEGSEEERKYWSMWLQIDGK